MFKTQDFEKLWFGYKTEGEPNSMSIERYCMMKGVPYSQFEKWFRSTRKEILPIQVDGVIGKKKCSDFGKMKCSKIGNNGTVFSATRVQYNWQQCCSTSKGSYFLVYSII